jgi:O-antigen ligase
MTSRWDAWRSAGGWLVMASLALTPVNLIGAEACFGLAAILWVAGQAQGAWRWTAPAYVVPLGLYAAWTLVSAAFSPLPVASIVDSKQLVLFLIVPLVVTFVRADRAALAVDLVVAVGASVALLGVVQYAMFGYDDLSRRPVGALSHYMTFSGVLMLVTCAAVARLLYSPLRRAWPAIALPALLAALLFTQARNAWIGTVLALSVLVAIKQWRALIVVPIAALAIVALAPSALRDRVYSIADPADPTNRDRVAMALIGSRMVADRPLVGVGPEMVERRYADYRDRADIARWAVNPTNPHLHNVPVQIAAERGLPALAAWIAFVLMALGGLVKRLRAGVAPVLSATGVAAIVGMLSAGLFEYNFGDSEFLMLFLGLIALPFAAGRDRDAPGADR